MNKTELTNEVAQRTELPKKDVAQIVNATFDIINEALVQGERVQIFGFGTFETKERSARVGRNPHTKQTIQIAASRVPVFKASKGLKDSVAKE